MYKSLTVCSIAINYMGDVRCGMTERMRNLIYAASLGMQDGTQVAIEERTRW